MQKHKDDIRTSEVKSCESSAHEKKKVCAPETSLIKWQKTIWSSAETSRQRVCDFRATKVINKN